MCPVIKRDVHVAGPHPKTIALLIGLIVAGCQLLPAARTALEGRVDHFQSAALVCGEPHIDPDYAGLVATQVECHGAVSGVQMVVTIDDHPQGAPLVSASVSQASSRSPAVDAWSTVVLPMPGLELVRVELAVGLEDWARGGPAMFSMSGGLAWVSTGEAGDWTLSVDPD